ncbi:hypothetical protein J6TS2_42910 [Heyndrickxia sporothermodurans]|nr:hypothetical protein J6TS2_42910 [Heyndrickxia sporothermodurans]
MKIYRVQLNAFHIDKMKDFYTKLLQMELIYQGENSFAVLEGTTRVYFEKGDTPPHYHVCF